MNDLHLVIERNKKKSNKYAFTKRETPVRLRSAGRLMNWVAMMMEWFSFFFFFFPLRAAASSVEEEEKKWLGEESGVCLAYLFCYIAAALLLSLLKDFVASHIAVTSPSVRKKTQKRKKPNLVFLERKKRNPFLYLMSLFFCCCCQRLPWVSSWQAGTLEDYVRDDGSTLIILRCCFDWWPA